MRHCPFLFVFVWAGLTSDVCGQSLTVDPPYPLDSTPVRLSVACSCADGCTLDCYVEGGWVGPEEYYIKWITATWSWWPCPTVCAQLGPHEFELGVLPIGDYTVIVTDSRILYPSPNMTCDFWWDIVVGYSTTHTFHVYSVCDFDLDTYVDAYDFYEFRACYGGPNSALGDDCTPADVDSDDDVDLRDFAVLQAAFTG